jgi:hypothetical protein
MPKQILLGIRYDFTSREKLKSLFSHIALLRNCHRLMKVGTGAVVWGK